MNNYELPQELIDQIEAFLNVLDQHGWELNDDGDIVEKDTKKLVLDYRWVNYV